MLDELLDIHGLNTKSHYILPKFERMASDINNRLETIKIRYDFTVLADSSNVQLLRQMINICGEVIRELFYIKEDVTRLVFLLNPKQLLFIEQRIDSFRTQSFYSKTFLKTSTGKGIVESVIPVTMNDPLKSLPIMEYEKYKWADIKPLRIMYFDSNELVSDFEGDPTIIFKRDNPSVAIVTLDMIALLLKFVNYCTDNGFSANDELPVNDFLKKEVFYHQFEDCKNIWLLNLFNRLLDDDLNIHTLSNEYKSNKYTVTDYTPYLFELKKTIDNIKSGSVDVRFVINSRLFGRTSLMDKLKYINTCIRTKDLRQYKHLDFSIQLPYINLLLKFLKYSTIKALKRSISYEMKREILLYKRNRLHMQFRHVYLQNWFLSQLNEMEETIDSFGT